MEGDVFASSPHPRLNSLEESLDDLSNFTEIMSTATILNGSLSADAENSNPSRRHVPFSLQMVLTGLYLFGIFGNCAALFIMSRNEAKRYKKQTMMLRSLALNDLLALLGSFILMNVNLYVRNTNRKVICGVRVLWRAFGLGSGCIAVVMAVDRWMALAHPFRYQKLVTPAVVRKSIVGLWAINLVLVLAPFFGFGHWFDETKVPFTCVRYRDATSNLDRTYAYLVFTFGLSMCICIVCCNAMVIKTLVQMGAQLIARRTSRSSMRSCVNGNKKQSGNESTREELSFAKLMGILSVFFVVCWLPQLVTIITAQFKLLPSKSFFYKICDLLIALNFTLDPYLYVIFRQRRQRRRQSCPNLDGILCGRSCSRGSPDQQKLHRIQSSNGGSSWSGDPESRTGTTFAMKEDIYLPTIENVGSDDSNCMETTCTSLSKDEDKNYN